MKAFLILEDGTVLTGESFGAAREVISEVVFNTSMTDIDRPILRRTVRCYDLPINW